MKIFRLIKVATYHMIMILSICFITFSILVWFNPLMNFTENTVSAKLLIFFCIISLISSVLQIARSFRYRRNREY